MAFYGTKEKPDTIVRLILRLINFKFISGEQHYECPLNFIKFRHILFQLNSIVDFCRNIHK